MEVKIGALAEDNFVDNLTRLPLIFSATENIIYVFEL